MPPTTDLSRVGAVIVTYASAEHIAGCLDTLAPAGLGAVVVVDNDSPDGTRAVLHARRDPGLLVVEQDNVGFGGGCNAGARALPADVDTILFCNPDARISHDDIARLLQRLDKHERCAVVGPRLRCGDQVLTSAGSAPRFLTELRPLLPGAVGRLLPRRQLPPGHDEGGVVGYVEGACMLARRTAFTEVGGFDEGYFLCFEEMDLASRLATSGWDVQLEPTAWAEHCAGQSRASIPFAGRNHATAGLLRYLTTHHGPGTAAAYARAARLSLWLRRWTGRVDQGTYFSLVRALKDPAGTDPRRRTPAR